MSAKDQIKQIVDFFKKEPELKDKTDGMAEGLLLGAQLADDANELSKETDASFKALQREYTENGNGSQTTAEITVARDGELVLDDRLKRDFGNVNAQLAQTATKAEVAKKADQSFVDSQFSAIVGGSPKGTYTNLESLKNAYPDGVEGIFLVIEDGYWYWWNEEILDWDIGGIYQSTGYATDEVTAYIAMNENINFAKVINWEIGGIDADGENTTLMTGIRSTRPFISNKDLRIKIPANHNIRIHAYNKNGTLNQINVYSKDGVMEHLFKPYPDLMYRIVIYGAATITIPELISNSVIIEDLLLSNSELYQLIVDYITNENFELKNLWGWEIGGIDANGQNTALTTGIRNKEPALINKSINIKLPVNTNIRIHAYNLDGTLNKANVYSKNATQDNIFTPQKGLKYRFVIFRASNITNVSDILANVSITIRATLSPLKDEVVNIIADSQSSDSIVSNVWWKQIAAETGAIFNNYAVSGTSIAVSAATASFGEAMVKRYLSMSTNADVVIFTGGENDDDVPIGAWNSMNENEFMGALNIILQGLKKMYPNKLIITMTQIQNAALWDKVIPDATTALVNAMNTAPNQPVSNQLRAEAIRLKSSQYGYYCIDLWSNSGLNGVDEGWSDYNGDDYLHKSLQGETKEARYIKGVLTMLLGA